LLWLFGVFCASISIPELFFSRLVNSIMVFTWRMHWIYNLLQVVWTHSQY
jgi:hypothetical protein